MLKILGISCFASLVIMGSLARADSGSDEISKDEIKAIIEDSMAEQPNRDNQMKERNIDEKTGTSRVTNAERARKANNLALLKSGKEVLPTDARTVLKFLPRFISKCGIHPDFKIDVALWKDFDPLAAGPIDQILEGLESACFKPVDKAFIQKFKVIHFKVAKSLKQPNMYNFDFDSKTGELIVEARKYGPENIAEGIERWVDKQ